MVVQYCAIFGLSVYLPLHVLTIIFFSINLCNSFTTQTLLISSFSLSRYLLLSQLSLSSQWFARSIQYQQSLGSQFISTEQILNTLLNHFLFITTSFSFTSINSLGVYGIQVILWINTHHCLTISLKSFFFFLYNMVLITI